jgi:deoxyribodipyrimidine photo-lyase
LRQVSHKYTKSIFVFRRELRLDDNTGLIAALQASKQVIPCYIFDPRQVEDKQNPYKSNNALQFMIESIIDLDKQILSSTKSDGNSSLHIFYGEAENIIEQLLQKAQIDAVFSNRDYTPFSKSRDDIIKQVCEKYNVSFCQFSDYLLNEPVSVLEEKGFPFKVFGHFYKKVITNQIRHPQKYNCNEGNNNFFTLPINSEIEEKDNFYNKLIEKPNESLYVHGGRSNCIKILANLHNFKDYESERHYPAKLSATTHLSAHIKFGTCSIREVFYAVKERLGIEHPLIRQLFWRDFFTYIAYHFPHVFGAPFNRKYENKIKWNNDICLFKAWCNGLTGFPIVDAGMRQLNSTGYIPNKIRMIVATFLTKDLQIDWQWGEKYFAQKLVDYDPSVNNGSWQWVASTGCNRQHHFRIINPWIQQKKFDPECEYIKKWVVELQDIPANSIHNLNKQRPMDLVVEYPFPIVNHSQVMEMAENHYR